MLLIARILGPEVTGITAGAITLLLTYTMNAHIGSLNALGQRYPFLVGQGTAESRSESERMLRIVLGFIGIASLVSGAIVFGIAVWQYFRGAKLFALGLCFGAVLTIFQLIKTYYFFLIRSTNQFEYLSRFTLLFAWVPLAYLAGARWGGVLGQWMMLAATELLMSISLYLTVGREIRWEFDLKASWGYVKLGFPIYVVGALFSFFTTIDRLAAASFLGTTMLGYYGVASMACSILGMIPGVIGQIMWPRIGEKLGSAGDKWAEIVPYIEKPTFLMAFLLPPVIGVVVMAIPPATEILLPRYLPGVAAAQISVLTVYILGLMGMYGVFLGNSLRLLPYGLITGLGVVIGMGGAYMAVRLGWGLEGIAWVKNMSHGVVAILLLAYVEKLFGRGWKRLFQRVLFLLAPMVIVTLLTFWLIPRLIPNAAAGRVGILQQFFHRVILLSAFTIPLTWYAFSSSGITGDVSVMVRRALRLKKGG